MQEAGASTSTLDGGATKVMPPLAPEHEIQRRASPTKGFTTLQAGRAVAALMVVVFHAHAFFLVNRLYPGQTVSPLFDMGYSGVEFFFVLSGFIMFLVHRSDMGRPDRAPNFLMKRVTRILPFYWIVLVGLVAVLSLVPGAGPEGARDPLAIVRSIFLIRTDQEFIIRAAWTLSHEMLFYAVFCLMIVSRRIGTAIFAFWIVGCFVTSFFYPQAPYPLWYVFAAFNILFLFGMASARSYSSLSARSGTMLAVFGTAMFLGVGVLDVYGAWFLGEAVRTLAYGVGAALAIAGLAAAEAGGRLRAPSWFVFLGDASYSIYLVHGPVLAVVTMISLRLGAPSHLPAWVMLVVLWIAGTSAGILAHLLIERPLLARMRRRSPLRRQAASAAA